MPLHVCTDRGMAQTLNPAIAVVGIDIGKNSFHVVGHDERGAIVPRQKWSRGQVETRFANMPPCLVGMEAFVLQADYPRLLRALAAAGQFRCGALKALVTFSGAFPSNVTDEEVTIYGILVVLSVRHDRALRAHESEAGCGGC